jgi:hypothetical protein
MRSLPRAASPLHTAAALTILVALVSVLGWRMFDCTCPESPECGGAGSRTSIAVREPAPQTVSAHRPAHEPDQRVEVATEPAAADLQIGIPADLSLKGATHCGPIWSWSADVPRIIGVVSTVKGDLVTIQITEKPPGVQVRPGYSFAVWTGSTYKGEARVRSESRNIAVCSVPCTKPGTIIQPGDHAATRTD